MTPARKEFVIELVAMLGMALAITLFMGLYIDGKMNWTVTGVVTLLALILVCVPRLVTALQPPKKFSPKELEEAKAAVEKDRLKLIQRLGWHWKVCGDALCKLDNKTGEPLERIDHRLLTEVWGVNTDEGPWLEDFWFLAVCGEKEYSIGFELATDEIRDWFLALEEFDHQAFSECMCCTDNRKTLLWKEKKHVKEVKS